MLNKLTCGLLIGGFAASVSAQTITNIQANKPYSAYVQDNSGTIVRSQFGLCWRTEFWTAADAVVGCDGVLEPPVAKSIAPAFVAVPDPIPATGSVLAPAPAPIAVPAPAPIAKPAPISEKINLDADALFDSGKADLKLAGKSMLDGILSKFSEMNLEAIIATGHTDSAGSAAFNQQLSVKRAEAVKAYLTSKGIEASRITTEGKGETQAIAPNKTAAGRAQNRRVEIEIIGNRNK